MLLDEDLKREYENEKASTVAATKDELNGKKKTRGFWVKADPGYKFYPRWQIIFPDENLEKWLKKIVKGCELRRLMDSLLRYNYYVDNMPV